MADHYTHGVQEPLHFVEKELNTNLGSGNFIFIGSSCDMFANAIPAAWIARTLDKANWHDNRYLLQSKNPERFINCRKMISPEKYTLCTTIETNGNFECMGKTPSPYERAAAMLKLKQMGYDTMITIEPICDFGEEFIQLLKMCQPTQINIGADTGCNHLPEPPPEKIAALIGALRKFTRVHLKKNLARLYREAE
jgi:DNA repair photolyase